jgi:hypothetical protein
MEESVTGNPINVARTFCLLAGVTALCPTSALAKKVGDRIADSYICVFKDGPISAGSEARRAVQEVGGSIKHVYSHAINGFAAHMSATAVSRLRERNPFIAYCEQDRVVGIPLDEVATAGRPGGGGGGGSSQTVGWNITRVGGAGDGNGKTAWVIDSGIDFSHPDLVTDPGRSISFLPGVTSAADQNGHGTHVAGIIGAKNNTIGVVGVAAGATLVSLRVLDATGYGEDLGVIAAVDYLARQVGTAASAGDVANLSLETVPLDSLDAAVVAVAATGVRVTIAAGNDSQNAGNFSPARANGTNVYTVAAFGRFAKRDAWASYSNYGQSLAGPVDYAEPGSSITSTVIGGYGTKSGTSMAAPHLAGILLLGPAVTKGTVARTSSDVYPVGSR